MKSVPKYPNHRIVYCNAERSQASYAWSVPRPIRRNICVICNFTLVVNKKSSHLMKQAPSIKPCNVPSFIPRVVSFPFFFSQSPRLRHTILIFFSPPTFSFCSGIMSFFFPLRAIIIITSRRLIPRCFLRRRSPGST